MAELEDDIRQVLRDAAPEASADLRDDVERRVRRIVRRRRIGAATCVLAIVAVAGLVVAAVAATDDGDETIRTVDSTTTTVPPAVGTWRPIAESPLSARARHKMVWTGEEVLVVGGSSDPECLGGGGAGCFDAGSTAPGVREGAAYDPDADRWRRIADAPAPIGVYETAVRVGDVALFTSGFGRRLWAYDPDADRWTEPAAPPPGVLTNDAIPVGLGQTASIGGTWIVVPDDDLAGQPDLSYDPATDRWSELPDDPLGPSLNRSIVWTGSRLVLLATTPGGSVQNPLPTRVATYDPDTSTWTRLPDSQITYIGLWFDAGTDAVATFGAVDTDGTIPPFPASGIIDLSTGASSPLPTVTTDDGDLALGERLPSSNGGPSWHVTAINNRQGSEGWLQAPETGALHRLPAPPGRPSEQSVDVQIWTGTDLIRWGGTSIGEEQIDDSAGVAYRPPPP